MDVHLTATKLPKSRPGSLRREVFELRKAVLSSPGLFWRRWALRGRSRGGPEASRGRSGSARGGLGEVLGTFRGGLGSPRTLFSEFFRLRKSSRLLLRESSSRVDGSIENEVSRERKRSRNRSWGMQMTSQEPRREPRASRRSPRDVPSGHLGNSTTFLVLFRSKTWNRDDPGMPVRRQRVGGYCIADRILLQNLSKSASTSEHACQGAAD